MLNRIDVDVDVDVGASLLAISIYREQARSYIHAVLVVQLPDIVRRFVVELRGRLAARSSAIATHCGLWLFSEADAQC